jgi:hypothetical protein
MAGFDGQAGGGEAAVDQMGPVLDLLQLAFDDTHQVIQARGGEASRGAFEQGPDAFNRLSIMQGSLASWA